MERKVVTEITVRDGLGAELGWFRIVPDIGESGLFSIQKVTGEDILESQKQQGSDWKNEVWSHASETSGLPIGQAFRIIEGNVQRIVNPAKPDLNAPVGMRLY